MYVHNTSIPRDIVGLVPKHYDKVGHNHLLVEGCLQFIKNATSVKNKGKPNKTGYACIDKEI